MEEINKTYHNKVSVLYAIVMLAFLVLYTGVLAALNGYTPRNFETYCFLFLTIFIWGVILLSFFYFKVRAGAFDDKFRDMKNLFWLVFFACCYIGIFYVLPQYAWPLIVIPIVISVVINTYFSCLIPIALCSLYCLVMTGSNYEFICMVFMVFAGSLIGEIIKNKKNWLLCHIMVICITVVLSALFSYLGTSTFTLNGCIPFLAAGCVGAMVLIICMYFVDRYVLQRKERRIQQIMSDDFIVKKQMREFDSSFYKKSKIRAEICEGVAKTIGGDASLAKAGGMYYCICQMADTGVIGGVLMALEYDLPEKLIWILYEACGEIQYPTTLESGIAYIVYQLEKNLQKLDVKSAPIEREIAVHTTMNNLSVSGSLDACGISMNQYLKMKEYLVKASELYDH